jgi:homocitrate synthase NifV
MSVLQQHGIILNSEEVQSVLEAVRHQAVEAKRNLTVEELLSLVSERFHAHAI